MPGKRIAVIGAGVSGLGAIKVCLEEGLEPTHFEGSDDIGGVWRYEEKAKTDRPSIYKSVISNSSKEMTAYSDYPSPDHFPNYLPNSKIMEYLRMYVQHFGLMKHIHFLSKVCSVRKRSNFSCTGQWDVVVEAEGKQKCYVFDGVMVCSGLCTDPFLPLHNFPAFRFVAESLGLEFLVLKTGRTLEKIKIPETENKPWLEHERPSKEVSVTLLAIYSAMLEEQNVTV
ncbi:PREDICTED: dimethylaniline monooxygenase [N-oxide-forming] 5-like [Ceratotherium simum simum]|uniref:Flavin-containing monooxygenase n=1 Tax=Ceratotherium simum simum TaxID=73337 RepID=A0ABM1CGP5_CERSS|nr:PREDICTED: dimethylaniline monooxygenase [N-oxide-forming] 5-like [Ceratotherium simum simum]